MRIATFVLLGSISLSTSGEAATCAATFPLSPEQSKAVVNEQAGGDPVLEEAIALEHAKERDLPRTSDEPVRISWDQARRLILLGAVRVVAQHLDQSVFLMTRSGKGFTTREPKVNEVWRVVAMVDPCSVYTIKIAE